MTTIDSQISPPSAAELEAEQLSTATLQPQASSQPWLRRLIQEPLLHFLVLGGLVFGLYFWVHDPTIVTPSSPSIEVSAPVINGLQADWQRQWGRSPTASELQTLVDQYVRDEVFYQEARALGLDQNDIIVRRRLIQKVEFLAEQVAALREPNDETLQAYLAAHRDRYVIPGRVSFDQIYFSRELRGDRAEAEARQQLTQLQARPQQAVTSDRSMLPSHFTLASSPEVARVFGEAFATQLTALTATGWQGPFSSAYGTHLVNVTEVEPGHDAQLAEVRNDVRLDWLRDQQLAQNEKFYQQLRDRYTIQVDQQALVAAVTEVNP